ncbi:hypothetical protein K488DRAFT_83456 [Vararia minispora EC-137]|uniref:Uncharacterized protein n=1 Tax=Vararia minispora EC-137 TaxID=1314806 RepID=A0ACB8QT56_9AGAM|nr:hypothetical protein K488DRAFT_83456 [Vararia minispora EC-137]
MDALSSLPTELLHHIVTHAHSTTDILALAATARTLHAALSSPTIFERRIRAAGWDVARWAVDACLLPSPDLMASSLLPPPVLEHWRRASALHDRARDLLDEAQKGFVHTQEGPQGVQLQYPRWTFSDWPARLFDVGAPDLYPSLGSLHNGGVDSIDGRRAIRWFIRFGNVLEELLTHHESRNIMKLLDPYHDKTWLTVLRVLLGTVYDRTLFAEPHAMPDVLAQAAHLVRATHAFMLFVLAGQASTPFLPAAPHLWGAALGRFCFFEQIGLVHARFFYPGIPLKLADADTLTRIRLERRRALCAIAVIMLYLLLRFRHHPSDSLPPPTLPHCALVSTAPLAGANDVPDAGLAGTPLQALLELGPGATQDWVGYHIHARETEQWAYDSPMFLTLSAARAPAEPGMVLFTGHGSEQFGTFRLSGRVAARTGAFSAHKVYTAGFGVDWCGFVNAAGIAGSRSMCMHGGMLWLWPRAWSKE